MVVLFVPTFTSELFDNIYRHFILKWDSNHGRTNARLDKPAGGGKTGAWSAKSNNVNQWIQVTFLGDTRVTALGIQGRSDLDQWVTSYRVSYSHDGISFLLESTVSLNCGTRWQTYVLAGQHSYQQN